LKIIVGHQKKRNSEKIAETQNISFKISRMMNLINLYANKVAQ